MYRPTFYDMERYLKDGDSKQQFVQDQCLSSFKSIKKYNDEIGEIKTTTFVAKILLPIIFYTVNQL